MHPVSKESTCKLLFMKSARKISNEEIKELINCKIPRGSKIAKFVNQRFDRANGNRDQRNLLNHPFITLLGGHPQAISLTAPLLKDSTLKDLFLTFCQSNLIDVVHENSVVQNATTSLRVSLEMSIKHVREKFPESLDLFGLIGLLPSGVNKEELEQLWGGVSWKRLKDVLVRSSLLIHKSDTQEPDVYYMLPFMSERACEIISENKETKKKFHYKCCTLYKNYCYEFYCSSKDIIEIEGLASIESNIWACIYRALEDEEDSSIKNKSKSMTLTGDEMNGLTPGGPTEYSTPRASSIDVDDSYLNDVLLDLETYRSLSYANFEEEKSPVDRRKSLLSMNDWDQEEMNNGGQASEELMIIYYCTSLIFLNKNQDAFRAVSEYMKKDNVSEIGQANLYRIHAFLLMISIEYEYALSAIK